MKPQIAKEWIERLRSGNIEQLTERLGNEKGERCCLGVLCDIAVERGITQAELVTDSPSLMLNSIFYGIGVKRECSVLPDVVKEWAGMQSEVGVLYDAAYKGGITSLSEMNDDGSTFEEIAEVIEKHQDEL